MPNNGIGKKFPVARTRSERAGLCAGTCAHFACGLSTPVGAHHTCGLSTPVGDHLACGLSTPVGDHLACGLAAQVGAHHACGLAIGSGWRARAARMRSSRSKKISINSGSKALPLSLRISCSTRSGSHASLYAR